MPEDERLYVYTRTLDNEKLLVICNFTEEIRKMELPEEFKGREGSVMISNYGDIRPEEELTLRAYEAVVFKF